MGKITMTNNKIGRDEWMKEQACKCILSLANAITQAGGIIPEWETLKNMRMEEFLQIYAINNSIEFVYRKSNDVSP
jgi:hypothetical protein